LRAARVGAVDVERADSQFVDGAALAGIGIDLGGAEQHSLHGVVVHGCHRLPSRDADKLAGSRSAMRRWTRALHE